MRGLVVLATVGVFVAGCAGTALAGEPSGGPEVGIAASTSWVKDLNSPGLGSATTTGGLNSASYPSLGDGAVDESFNLDLVELSATGRASENVSYEASLFFGDIAGGSGETDSNGDSPDVGLHTASVTFPIGVIQTTVGRRATDIGYEVIQPWGNAHISRSFAWLAQPINHDGVKFGYDGGSWSAGVGMANEYSVAEGGGSNNDVDKNKAATADVQFGVGGWGFKVAGITTEDAGADLTDVNVVIQGDIGVLQTAFEYNFFDLDGGGSLGGLGGLGSAVSAESDTFALYLGQDADCWGWDARLEYVDLDFKGPGAPASGEVYGITLTGSWHITEGVDLRLEYRHNEASDLDIGGGPDNVFLDDTSLDDSQDTVALQVVMW